MAEYNFKGMDLGEDVKNQSENHASGARRPVRSFCQNAREKMVKPEFSGLASAIPRVLSCKVGKHVPGHSFAQVGPLGWCLCTVYNLNHLT